MTEQIKETVRHQGWCGARHPELDKVVCMKLVNEGGKYVGHGGGHYDPDRHTAWPQEAPTKTRAGDQRLPDPDGKGECVQDEVIRQMEESKRVGTERYGDVLRTYNGRRSIQDVQEEARDLFVYLTQIRMETESTREDLIPIVGSVLMNEIPHLSLMAAGALSELVVDRILGHVAGRVMES